MWVEEKDLLSFNEGDPIAVVYDQNPEKVEGTFHSTSNDGLYVRFTTTDGRELGASHLRRFYRWEEDKPEDSVNQLDVHVDQSKLRLRKGVKLHAHVGEIIANQQPPTKRAACVVVGSELFTIREGEHMRVWWEDGRLHTEHVQGESE